jgi:nucleotide-binding universal stress UspA family protein
MTVFRRILHPTDFSRASRAALDKALELARQGDAELLLVHVVLPPGPMVGEGFVSPRTYEILDAQARRSAEKALAKLAEKARTAKVRVTTVLLHGIPHERIVEAARAKRADLIVMGTHGRAGLSKLFLGSVAGRVVQLARCPVLTVRGR